MLVLVLLAAPAAPAQTTARLPGGTWSITVPEGWEVGDAQKLKLLNDAVAGVRIAGVSEPIKYVMVLSPKEPDGCYAIVQWGSAPPAGGTFDGYVKGLTAGLSAGARNAREAMPDQIASASFDEPIIDRKRHRVYLPGETRAPSGDSLKLVTCPMVGCYEVITVHVYAPAPDFAGRRSTLMTIPDSFAFDAGYEYEFAASAGLNFGRIGTAGLVGAGIGGLAWLLRKIARR